MRLVRHLAAIHEGSGLAAAEFGLPHEEVDRNALRQVIDDLLASLACRCRRVLALPVEGVLIDSVVVVPMLLRLALLVQGHQQDVHLLVVQHDVTDVPTAWVERLSEERRYVLA